VPIGTYPDPVANEGKGEVDFDSPVGVVRLLIGDVDPKPETLDATTGDGEFVFYSDREIEAFLKLRAGSPQRAAATILRTIAVDQSLKLKKWSSADLMVDGPAITAQLLAAARECERLADQEDGAAGLADTFKLVPVGGYDPFIHGLR
jgi:hypothetical protein